MVSDFEAQLLVNAVPVNEVLLHISEYATLSGLRDSLRGPNKELSSRFYCLY
jgi:hypothetical protein